MTFSGRLQGALVGIATMAALAVIGFAVSRAASSEPDPVVRGDPPAASPPTTTAETQPTYRSHEDSPSLYGPELSERQVERRLGQSATDNGLEIEARSLRPVGRVTTAGPLSDGRPVLPEAGGGLIEGRVSYRNRTDGPLRLFCGIDALLLDTREQDYRSVDNTFALAGNQSCSRPLAPGASRDVRYAFQVPVDVRIDRLVLWNGAARGDSGGSTNVAFLPG